MVFILQLNKSLFLDWFIECRVTLVICQIQLNYHLPWNLAPFAVQFWFHTICAIACLSLFCVLKCLSAARSWVRGAKSTTLVLYASKGSAIISLGLIWQSDWTKNMASVVLLTKIYLKAHNWQKWKSVFLTCPCHNIYRDEAVGLKSCKYTWKITIFVKMWNLGQYHENLIFCQ